MPPAPAAVRTAARRASRLLPGRSRAAAFRVLAPALRVRGSADGLATLVVLCEEVDLPRLPDTLDSIGDDAHAYREVLLAPVGDAAERAVRDLVRPLGDPRVRLLPAQPTWQDAANAGADAATGRYLQLLRACDPRPHDALAALVASLAGSGSDLAAGGITQRGRAAVWLQRTTDLVHDRDASRLTAADHPVLAGDLGLGNKLLRTQAWRRSGCRLTPLDGWLLAPTLAAYLVRLRTFDVVARPVQEHVAGHGTRPFGAMPSPLRDLGLWAARAEQVERTLAGTPFEDGWRRHVRDVALPGFLMDAERATDDDWDLLRRLADRCEPGDGDDPARAESRTLLWLTRAGRRADVVTMGLAAQQLDGDLPTNLSGRHVVGAWPGLPDDLPEDVRRLSVAETSLVAAVRRLRPRGDLVDVELFVRVDQLDVAAHGHRLTATLPTGDPVRVTTEVDPAAVRWGGSRFHRALLARASVPASAGTLRLDLAVGELRRSSELALVEPHRRHDAPDPSVVLSDLRLDGDQIVVEHTGRLRLVDEDDQVLGESSGGPGRLDLSQVHYGRERWLPTGFYRLLTPDGLPTVTDDLVARLPVEQVGPRHRLTATLGPAGGVLLRLGPPLGDDEQGPWAQEQLVRGYLAAEDRPVDPSLLYFESYAGRSATDSPRVIHDAVRARRPDLTTYWGVLDHAQDVPAGATPLLLRSRAWYDVLARAHGIVLNTDVEAWFRRRPGQVLLQTFHGYPSKGMGLVQWRAAQLPPSQVAVLRARGVDTWSAIVTPTPEMTRHYREQYSYTGPAFEHGYPRNDLLVRADEAAAVRRRTRALLGIRDDQTAVLYAPTWREHQATRPRKADMVDHLDVDAAARMLGESHVLLLRGHRFHDARSASPYVLDVSDHPEVNDLLLAADVSVLDYSSLRFDFALTGNPMVFLVPDLQEYAGGTRSFLFPFEDSAPGPFVDDTAGVVEQVRDVAALRREWADRIAAFNATYHPHQDGHAAERVAEGLLELLATSRPGSPGNP